MGQERMRGASRDCERGREELPRGPEKAGEEMNARAKKAGARGKAPKFLWITDPWETLDHPNDTTLRLAEEALKLGLGSAWCDVKSIRWEPGCGTQLDARPFVDLGGARYAEEIQLGATQVKAPGDFPSLQYRTDPPVDLRYLQPLQLLLLGLPSRSRIVNPAPILALS